MKLKKITTQLFVAILLAFAILVASCVADTNGGGGDTNGGGGDTNGGGGDTNGGGGDTNGGGGDSNGGGGETSFNSALTFDEANSDIRFAFKDGVLVNVPGTDFSNGRKATFLVTPDNLETDAVYAFLPSSTFSSTKTEISEVIEEGTSYFTNFSQEIVNGEVPPDISDQPSPIGFRCTNTENDVNGLTVADLKITCEGFGDTILHDGNTFTEPYYIGERELKENYSNTALQEAAQALLSQQETTFKIAKFPNIATYHTASNTFYNKWQASQFTSVGDAVAYANQLENIYTQNGAKVSSTSLKAKATLAFKYAGSEKIGFTTFDALGHEPYWVNFVVTGHSISTDRTIDTNQWNYSSDDEHQPVWNTTFEANKPFQFTGKMENLDEKREIRLDKSAIAAEFNVSNPSTDKIAVQAKSYYFVVAGSHMKYKLLPTSFADAPPLDSLPKDSQVDSYEIAVGAIGGGSEDETPQSEYDNYNSFVNLIIFNYLPAGATADTLDFDDATWEALRSDLQETLTSYVGLKNTPSKNADFFTPPQDFSDGIVIPELQIAVTLQE